MALKNVMKLGYWADPSQFSGSMREFLLKSYGKPDAAKRIPAAQSAILRRTMEENGVTFPLVHATAEFGAND